MSVFLCVHRAVSNADLRPADDMYRLRLVLEAAQLNIHGSTHLFKLAQDAFRFATSAEGPRPAMLLSAALELGLQVRLAGDETGAKSAPSGGRVGGHSSVAVIML